MSIFYLIYGLLGMLLLVALFNVCTAPMVKNGPRPQARPKVSLLVPARNEEKSILTCLASLIGQDYEPFEIIVLDDHSIDATAALTQEFAIRDPRVRCIAGRPLSVGWTGKNWACHQLQQAASGDILIFSGPDTFFSPDAVSRTVGWIQKLDLQLFSAVPQQITVSWGEKLVVPVFDLLIYSFLPLWLTYRSRYPSLSAANDQWLAFTRSGYDQIGGHAAIRGQTGEGAAIARRAKSLGCKILTASGRDAVFGRMYHSFTEVWYGFSQNAFGLVNFQTLPYFAMMAILLLAFVLPYGLAAYPLWTSPALVAIALNILLRLILAVKFKQPLLFGVLLHPLGALLTVAVALSSFYYYLIGNILWKERAVPLRDGYNHERHERDTDAR